MKTQLSLIHAGTARSADEDRALAKACIEALACYRSAVASGTATDQLCADARRAFLHLGGDPARATISLKEYDHERYGPFLGVSDEGSAAGAIRDAALESPKAQVLSSLRQRTPLAVGVSVDAERLAGVGEVAVGPDEYADIWLATVDRVLVTTNIGTQVNARVYSPEPRVIVRANAIERAKEEIADAFRPFLETPDQKPRPRTVFVEFPRGSRLTIPQKKGILRDLSRFVSSGKASGADGAPDGHRLGLAVRVASGKVGRDRALAAIDLAATSKMSVVLVDGAKSKEKASAVVRGGLRESFRPALIAQILRHAAEKNVVVRSANLPDTETIARSTWVGLNTARCMGAHVGKYGCVPLTLDEINDVVEHVNRWLPNWSPAPVFFVDQGLIRPGAVDVESDLPRGIEIWLREVAKRGAHVVLIDTVDKASGRRLLRKTSKDKTGYLGPHQIERIERFARRPDINIKILWAGGLGLRDAYEMGRRNVFGIYVTTAAATTVPVHGDYVRDPALAGLKEPTKEGVLRTKTLLEAGFLMTKLERTAEGDRIEQAANEFLSVLDSGEKDAQEINTKKTQLASACVAGWKTYCRRDGRAVD